MGHESLRVGIIGAGAIAPSHVHALARTPGAEVAAVCDQQLARAEALAHGLEVPAFGRVDDMLSGTMLDAVTICTPSGLHLDAALPALEAGKHVLVEKPLEITPERADRLIEAAEAHGVKLAAVYQARHRPVAARLKQLPHFGGGPVAHGRPAVHQLVHQPGVGHLEPGPGVDVLDDQRRTRPKSAGDPLDQRDHGLLWYMVDQVHHVRTAQAVGAGEIPGVTNLEFDVR